MMNKKRRNLQILPYQASARVHGNNRFKTYSQILSAARAVEARCDETKAMPLRGAGAL
jgi:hypothetical protein